MIGNTPVSWPIRKLIARIISADSPCLRLTNEIEDAEELYAFVYSWLASNSISEIKSP